jgi:hypothetical protein
MSNEAGKVPGFWALWRGSSTKMCFYTDYEASERRVKALESENAELRKDAGRLDALLKSSCAVVLMANGKYAIYNPSVVDMGAPVGIFDTPRAAIDAVMAGEVAG